MGHKFATCALDSANLPKKSNFQKHKGLDAITGKSNFDISEWMLIRLLESMNGGTGALAMLCKTSTARRVLSHAWKNGFALEQASIYAIDADLHFDAAVGAVLLFASCRPGGCVCDARVFGSLNSTDERQLMGLKDGMLLADMAAYDRWKHLCGESHLKWRSGIKHDCSAVMELRPEGRKYRNGLDQLVELEDDSLYPMLKSSEVAKGCSSCNRRVMLVTQRRVGDDTRSIERQAPKTWAYLESHRVPPPKAGQHDLSRSSGVLDLRRRRLQFCTVEGGYQRLLQRACGFLRSDR